MRKNVEKTPVFKKSQETADVSASPLREVFKNYKKEMISVFLLLAVRL